MGFLNLKKETYTFFAVANCFYPDYMSWWKNFVPLSSAMKFNEKFPQLKEKEALTQTLTNTVFSTMALEDQQVPKLKVKQIVSDLLKEQELKGDQFFSNQTC